MSGSPEKADQPVAEPSDREERSQRIAALVANHYGLVWRWLRRLGVWECDADDSAQQVFLTAHRRLAEIARGSERSFLLQTALRVAANGRRTRHRRREADGLDPASQPDLTTNPEELLDRRRARAMLDGALELLPMELRTVLVLFEIEELTMAEIATVVEIPPGTVASRLRRAREVFRETVIKLAAAGSARHQAGGTP
jgi:RNA polymerase sigma-70 factor (ECF subfamily)